MASFQDRIIRAAKLDVHLYEEVEADKGAMGQAMAVVILSSIAGGIGTPAGLSMVYLGLSDLPYRHKTASRATDQSGCWGTLTDYRLFKLPRLYSCIRHHTFSKRYCFSGSWGLDAGGNDNCGKTSP
jgi:hypothetical protein